MEEGHLDGAELGPRVRVADGAGEEAAAAGMPVERGLGAVKLFTRVYPSRRHGMT